MKRFVKTSYDRWELLKTVYKRYGTGRFKASEDIPWSDLLYLYREGALKRDMMVNGLSNRFSVYRISNDYIPELTDECGPCHDTGLGEVEISQYLTKTDMRRRKTSKDYRRRVSEMSWMRT